MKIRIDFIHEDVKTGFNAILDFDMKTGFEVKYEV